MTREHRRTKRKIQVIALLAMLAAAALLFTLNYGYHVKRNKESAQNLAQGERNRIEYLIDTRLADTEILEMLVVSHDGDEFDFDKLAELMYREGKAIRSIQLAPMGIIKHVYPLEGNEQAFFDLFAMPDRREDVKRARDTDQTTMAGPFELKQGGRGLVVNDPIYLPSEDGHRTFWGFSTVVFDVPDIFEDANLEVLEKQGYNYRLWKENGEGAGKTTILENFDGELKDAVSTEVSVPNSVWYLDIEPKQGWAAPRVIWSWIVILTVIVFLGMFSLSAFLTSSYRKRELIKSKDVIMEQNHKDALTGLKNGLGFSRILKDYASRQMPVAVFFMDLDNFKSINDNYGRDEADALLKETAKRISECLGERDTVARISADEFAVIVPSEETEEYCRGLTERIKKSVAQPYEVKRTQTEQQISVGFARFPIDSDDMEDVVRIADMRMYGEKRERR